MKEKRKAFYKVCFSYWYHDLCKKVCRSDMLCPSVVSSYLYGALGLICDCFGGRAFIRRVEIG